MNEQRKRLRKSDSGWHVNNSGLDLIQTCARKGYYASLKPEFQNASLARDFGTCLHRGLECFYATHLSPNYKPDDVFTIFEAKHRELILTESSHENREYSIENGKKILKNFTEVYSNDDWELYLDAQGPIIEREFEFKLADNLFFFGTIDLVLQNRTSKEICAFDHKSTKTLSGFENRADTSHQLSGYIWALQQMGIQCKMGAFQGIQVAKTVNKILRVFTYRNEEQIEEWKDWVGTVITYYHQQLKHLDMPVMNGSSACYAYGGCQYLSACAAPKSKRLEVLNLLQGSVGDEE